MKKSILLLALILYPLLSFADSPTFILGVSDDTSTVYTNHIGLIGASVSKGAGGKAIITIPPASGALLATGATTGATSQAQAFTNGVTLGDASSIGLGAGKGLIQFDDETTDSISFSNANVGIGTTGPGYKLDVQDSGSPQVRIKSSGVGSAILQLDRGAQDTGSNLITGSTATAEEWYFGTNYQANTKDFILGISNTWSNRYERLRFTNPGTNTGEAVFNDGGVDVDFRVESDTVPGALFVDGTSGNVGIGTTAPGQLLSLSKSQNDFTRLELTNTNSETGAGANFFVSNDGTTTGALNGVVLGTAYTTSGDTYQDGALIDSGVNLAGGLSISARGASANMRFYTGGSADANERLRITSSGNVGIGGTNPLDKLQVYSATDDVRIRIETDKVNGVAALRYTNDARTYSTRINASDQFQIRDVTDNAARVTIDTSGNLAIGTEDFDGTPAIGRLIVQGTTNDGTTYVVVLRDSDGVNVAWIDTNGDLHLLGDIYVADQVTVTLGIVQIGEEGTSGVLKLYSEQGATDYIASLYANTAMTSAASFYLPADEPAVESFLKMGTDGVIDYDTATYQAADADLTTWAGITPGANVGTFLATPSSANLLAAITDETGSASGSPLLVFNQNPTINGAILTGTINAGAAVFEIPNGATVTDPALAGEVAIDTTSGQFLYHDGTAQRILTYNNRKCFGWFDPADTDDDIETWIFDDAATVTNVSCRVSGGTSLAVVGGDGTNNFESITCDADGATDDGSITNATFTAGEVFELDCGAPSGTVPSFLYCIDFTTTAD